MFPPMAQLLSSLPKLNPKFINSLHPDEGLTLGTSALKLFYGHNLTLINSFDVPEFFLSLSTSVSLEKINANKMIEQVPE